MTTCSARANNVKKMIIGEDTKGMNDDGRIKRARE